MKSAVALLGILAASALAGANANDTATRDRFAKASPERWEALEKHEWKVPTRGRGARRARIENALKRLGFDGADAQAPMDGPDLAEVESSLRGNPVLLEMQRRTQGPSLLGGMAGAVAMGFEAMMTTECIMCEYIVEVADRGIKSMPHWAHGGSGNFAGMTDFNAGNQQGYYRAYSGQYLQMDAGVVATDKAVLSGKHPAPVGSGIAETVSLKAPRYSPAPTTPSEAASVTGEMADERAAHTDAALETSKRMYMARDSPMTADNLHSTSHRVQGDPTNFAPFKDYNHPRQMRAMRSAIGKYGGHGPAAGPTPQRNRFPSLLQVNEEPAELAGVDGGVDAAAAEAEAGAAPTDGETAAGLMTMPPRSPMRGRRTFRDFNRLDSVAEKDTEYSQMFDDMMDQFDDICQHDLPKEPTDYKKNCKVPYRNAEYLVELYLHGYEDYEICTKILACAPNFFESA